MIPAPTYSRHVAVKHTAYHATQGTLNDLCTSRQTCFDWCTESTQCTIVQVRKETFKNNRRDLRVKVNKCFSKNTSRFFQVTVHLSDGIDVTVSHLISKHQRLQHFRLCSCNLSQVINSEFSFLFDLSYSSSGLILCTFNSSLDAVCFCNSHRVCIRLRQLIEQTKHTFKPFVGVSSDVFLHHQELHTIKDLFLCTLNSRCTFSKAHTLCHVRNLSSKRSTYVRLCTHVIHVDKIIHVLIQRTYNTFVSCFRQHSSISSCIKALILSKAITQFIYVFLVERSSQPFTSIFNLFTTNLLTCCSTVTVFICFS